MDTNQHKMAQDWYKQGLDYYFNKDNPQESFRCLSLAIGLDPNFHQAYAERANVQRYLGNRQEALEDVERSIAIAPNCIAYYIKARILVTLGKKAEATCCLNLAEDQALEDGLSYFHKGAALFTMGKMREAVACFDQAINLNPEYAFAYFNKGSIHSYLGEKKEANECYDQTIQLNPQYALAYYNKGNALNDLGNKKGAVECYDKVIELNPSHALAYFNKGVALDDLGQREQAMSCYNQTIKLNPDYAPAYHNKGYALSKLGRKREAIFWYDKAIQVDPSYSSAYYNKGNALSDLGKKEEAVMCYDQAIRHDPNDATFYNQKGVTLSLLGKTKEAICCYNKAIKVDPENAFAYYNKGVALTRLGRKDEARSCYDQAIELNHSSFYRNKEAVAIKDEIISHCVLSSNKKASLFFQDLEDKEEVLYFYELATMLNPRDPRTYFEMGFTLYELGKVEEALCCYDKAIQLDSYSVLYYCNKGKVLNSLGQEEKALECFIKAHEVAQIADSDSEVDKQNNNQIIHEKKNLLKKLKELQEASVETVNFSTRLNQSDKTVAQYLEELVKVREKKTHITEKFISNLTEENKISHDSVKDDCKENLTEEQLAQMTQIEEEMVSLKQKMLNLEAKLKAEAALREGIKAEIIKGFKELERKDIELLIYCKTFYWTTINLFGAYKSLNAQVIQGEDTSEPEQLLVAGASKMSSYGLQIIKGVAFTGGLIRAFDKVIETLYNPSKEAKGWSKSDAITKVIQNKFGDEDDISLNLGKLALAVTQAREQSILYPEQINQGKGEQEANWLRQKVDEFKGTVLTGMELEEKNSKGAELALFDAILFISYLCKYYERVIKRTVPLDIQFVDILKYRGLDVMLKAIATCLVFEDTKELETHLFNKLKEGQIELEDNITEHTFLDINGKEKILDYYNSFVKTFLEVYLTSQMIESRKLELESEDNRKIGVLSTLLCFMPVGGSQLSRGNESLDQLIKSEEMVNYAKRMKLLGRNPATMIQLVINCALAIVFDLAKQKHIINDTEKEGKTIMLFEEALKDVRSDKLRKEALGLVRSELYVEAYRTPAAKQGHNDANKLIQLWLSEKINGSSGSVDTQKLQELFNNEIIQKDKLDVPIHRETASLNPFKRGTCQLF